MADQQRVNRKLAAIFYADVVGYSRLTGTDEEGTHRAVAEYLDVLADAVSDHGGRVVHYAGDAVLADFASVVAAVRCAVYVQKGLAESNSEISDDRKVQFRIGINVGDVIVDRDDIYGNGVNVAARLEGLADPGGICVSGSVFEQVRGNLDVSFENMGSKKVKNIANPIHVFRVILDGTADERTAARDALFERPAIAVLPFENLSGDPEQEYFADGLTEDIITALSLWRSFPVIARNSTFAYKGQTPDIRKVGEELGVRYVVEGSVRKAGDRVRITAQLIDADTGHHVWAERYDRDLEDIFALQDELTERIAATVAPELERAERGRSGSKKPSDLQAWDWYLRGMAYIHETSKEGNRRAREMFERAVTQDPTYSRGHAGIAYSHHRDALLGYSDDAEKSITLCVEAAQRAVSYDDTDAFAHYVLSRGLHYAERIEQGLLEARQAIELNPTDSSGYASLGVLLMSAGRPDEGIDAMRRARQLSPKDPRVYLRLQFESYGHFLAGRYEEAAALLRDALNRRPGDPALRVQLAASLGNAGQIEEARSILTDGGSIDPALLDQASWFAHRFKGTVREQLLNGLRKVGWEV